MTRQKKIYWLCQFLGWAGLVAIETINYTFFIVGRFNLAYVISFSYGAVAGLFSTHVYKLLLTKTKVFEKPNPIIWLVAFVSALGLSAWLAFIHTIPSFVSSYDETIKQLNFISIVGSVVNWMRYVAVWIVIYFMYRVLERNRIVEEERLHSESNARLSELELLKTQLNPHFLFNALNSIKALVTLDPEKSKDAIVKLSELLRFTLNYGMLPLIPLNDELLEVRKYLALEQIRFGERLSIKYDIDENTLNQLVPPSIILTLAENAIKHGISKEPGNCILNVSSNINDGMFYIKMINSGFLATENYNGIGIRSVRKRLDNLYGGRAQFKLYQVDGGVVACLNIFLE